MGERSNTVPLRPLIMSADKRALSSSDLAGAAAGVTATVSGLWAQHAFWGGGFEHTTDWKHVNMQTGL